MRILWHSNSPWASTGYGVQTALFMPRIAERLGIPVAHSSLFGLEGGNLVWNGIHCYPKGFDQVGHDSAPAHAQNFGAEVILTLFDAWCLNPQALQSRGARWVPWFPVDSDPIPAAVLRQVQQAWQPVVFSRFGQAKAAEADLDVRYVPHGVVTSIYRAQDKAAERARRGLPQDAFVVGIVAANKGIPARKSWPEMLEAFARLWRRHDDAVLYLHTFVGQEMAGVNIREFCEHLGLPDHAVRVIDQYQNLLGFTPEWMAGTYAAFDVLMNVAMGEGFGVPLMEAQACGTPVITGAWTAQEELCIDGWTVAREDAEPWWTPQAAYQFKPRVAAIEDRLQAAYDEWSVGRFTSERSERLAATVAAQYDADLVTDTYWKPVLAEMAERIEAEKGGDLPAPEIEVAA